MKNEGDYILYSEISDDEMVRLSDYLAGEGFEINMRYRRVLDKELPMNLNWVGHYSDSEVLLARKGSRLEEALNKFSPKAKKSRAKAKSIT